MLWVEKYRPKSLKDVVASKEIIERVSEWAKAFSKAPQKPLLLAGPPGVGKTSLASALVNTFGWEVVELNASDQRNWEIIERIVGGGAFNETISNEGEFLSTRSGKMKLIVLDEVDNIHKKEDTGGEAALVRILKKKPRQPIILIANDPYQLSPELRKICEFVEFKRLTTKQIVRVLETICAKEGVKCSREVLEAIAENAGGDLRAAINDLQALAEGREEIKLEDVVVAKRTQDVDVFKILAGIFKTNYTSIYYDAMQLDEAPEDFIQWIEENLPLEYSGKELFLAYLALSRADIFLGRVKRRQFYRLWKYANYMMTIGVQQMKKEERKGFTRYKRPQIWEIFFKTKKKRELMEGILSKISRYSHLSKSKAKNEMLPILFVLFRNFEIGKVAKIAAFYEFSDEELEFLVGERAKEIREFIEKNKLHRVEESWISIAKEVEEVEEEAKEEDRAEKTEEKKDEKRGKVLTLDEFFS